DLPLFAFTGHWPLFFCSAPLAAGRKLASFSWATSAWFVLSHYIPKVNAKSKLALFGAFLSPRSPPHSLATGHLSPAPRPMPVGDSPLLPRAEPGTELPRPARVNMLRKATAFRLVGVGAWWGRGLVGSDRVSS